MATPISTPKPTPALTPDQKERLKKAGDNVNQGLGADGTLQDGTRVASLIVQKTGHSAGAIRAVADVANGETAAVDTFVRTASIAMRGAANLVAPAAASSVEKGLAPLLGRAGRTFAFVSKWAQVAALPFAALDVRDAIKEHDPKKKDAAIANATFSVVGGLAGAIGGFVWATPAGLPLLLVSSAFGALQLADHFLWDGKAMDWLGEHVVGPIHDLFRHQK
jgi:hypothetical protein